MGPTLKNAKVHFRTNNEDKDHDSHVTTIVRDNNGVTAARKDSDYIRFPDYTDHSSPLEVKNESTKESLQTGTIYIRLDPKGHDTWRFNWDIDLVFSDGSRFVCEVHEVQLSDTKREETWGIQGIIRQ